MKFSVVVVTYNRLELLKECLFNIRNQTYPAYKTIIVDNASTDGTAAFLDTMDKKSFYVIHEKENLGGAGGFKAGIQAAAKTDCDYILIIDDDAMLDSHFLEICNVYIENHPNCLACSGTVITDGTIQLNHRRVISNHKLFIERSIPTEEYSKETFEYELSTFCGMLISREIVGKIGLPADEYFIFYDDTEYSMRINKITTFTNINRAKLNHKTAVTAEKYGFYDRMSWKTYYGHRNRLDAAKRHLGKLTSLMVNLEFSAFIIGAFPILLNHNTHKRGKYIIKMLKDARKDGNSGKLGKNINYQRT